MKESNHTPARGSLSAREIAKRTRDEDRARQSERRDEAKSLKNGRSNKDWKVQLSLVEVGSDGANTSAEQDFIDRVVVPMLEQSYARLPEQDFDRLLKQVKDILYEKKQKFEDARRRTQQALESHRRLIGIDASGRMGWEAEFQHIAVGGLRHGKADDPRYRDAKSTIFLGLQKASLSLSGSQFADLYARVHATLWRETADGWANIREANACIMSFHAGVQTFGRGQVAVAERFIQERAARGEVWLRGHDDAQGDYAISFAEFERSLAKKRYQDIDPLALGAYLGHLRNNIPDANDRFRIYVKQRVNYQALRKLGDMISGDKDDDKLASRGYKSVTGKSLRADFSAFFEHLGSAGYGKIEGKERDNQDHRIQNANRGAELFRKSLEKHYGITMTDLEEKEMANLIFETLEKGHDSVTFIGRIAYLIRTKKWRGKPLEPKTIGQICHEAFKASDLSQVQGLTSHVLDEERQIHVIFPKETSAKTIGSIDGATAAYLYAKYKQDAHISRDVLDFLQERARGRYGKKVLQDEKFLKAVASMKHFDPHSEVFQRKRIEINKVQAQELAIVAHAVGDEAISRQAAATYLSLGGTKDELHKAFIRGVVIESEDVSMPPKVIGGMKKPQVEPEKESRHESTAEHTRELNPQHRFHTNSLLEKSHHGAMSPVDMRGNGDGTVSLRDPYTQETMIADQRTALETYRSKALFHAVNIPKIPLELSRRIVDMVRKIRPGCLHENPETPISQSQVFEVIDTIGTCLIGERYLTYKREHQPFDAHAALRLFSDPTEFRRMTGTESHDFHSYLERAGHIREGIFQRSMLERFEHRISKA